MWVHVVVAVTFKIGQQVEVAWTRAIYSRRYRSHGLTWGGILRPYILIDIEASAVIDSQEQNAIRPWLQFFHGNILIDRKDSSNFLYDKNARRGQLENYVSLYPYDADVALFIYQIING